VVLCCIIGCWRRRTKRIARNQEAELVFKDWDHSFRQRKGYQMSGKDDDDEEEASVLFHNKK
jgi:hypothetical protein